ncbi:hypothetical protein FCV25MIE_28720 [Fagus crenata]
MGYGYHRGPNREAQQVPNVDRTHGAYRSFGREDPGLGLGPILNRNPDHGIERPRAPNHDPHRFVNVDREPRQGSDQSIHDQDHKNYNRNREPLVLDSAPQDLDRFDRAPPRFNRTPPAFDHAPRFERAPPCVNLAQLGFYRAPSGYDLATPPFD